MSRSSVRTFAASSPFLCVLVFFVVSQGLFLVDYFVVPFPFLPVDQVVQSLLAVGVLVWLGWLRLAGFNGPSQWRSLHLLWLPGLGALFYISVIALTMHASGTMVILAALYALLNGLSEEARFRGVILQALLPYGDLRAALLSALLFGLLHAANLLRYSPIITLGYIMGAFLFGLGYAACRLRTTTLWPLVLFHACGDLAITLPNLSGSTVPAVLSNPLFVIVEVAFWFLLAGYGLFLLRPRPQSVTH